MTSFSKTSAAPNTTTTTNSFTIGAVAASQQTIMVDQPSLHSLVRNSEFGLGQVACGLSYPALRESLGRLGVPSDRSLLDILDEAIAMERPSVAAKIPYGEPRQ